MRAGGGDGGAKEGSRCELVEAKPIEAVTHPCHCAKHFRFIIFTPCRRIRRQKVQDVHFSAGR